MDLLTPELNIYNVGIISEPAEQTVAVTSTEVEEQGTVIVHCLYQGNGAVRIWPSTYLFDRGSSHRSKLLHAEDITIAPAWTMVGSKGSHRFTLFFESLPKSCSVFDLREVIPQPGAFEITAIRRNREDVYRVEIM
jgi:hypothetical protein